jgi:hypothetical protein
MANMTTYTEAGLIHRDHIGLTFDSSKPTGSCADAIECPAA